MTEQQAKGAAVVAGIGGLLAAVGTMLPWIKATTAFSDFSRTGLDFSDDAKVILVIGVACVLASVGRLTGWTMPFVHVSVGIAGAVGAAIAMYDYTQVSDRVKLVVSEDLAAANVGAGVYLCILGTALAALGGLALFVADRTAAAAARNGPVWNPPPGWQREPPSSQDWHPDPAWAPAPEGWVFWVPKSS